MNVSRLRVLVFIVILMSVSAQSADAAVQRMGLLPGSYAIGAAEGAKATIPSLCYDLTRSAPNAAASLGNVVNGASLLVQIGSEMMPLQTALNHRLIEFRGTNMPSDEAAIAAQLGDTNDGDYRNIRLINHSHKPVLLKVRETDHLVIAKERESAPTTASDNLVGDRNELQATLWMQSTAHYRSQLSNVGFYSDADSEGIGDDDIRPSVRRFQDAYNLPATGQVDAQTETALRRAFQAATVIRAANASHDNNYIVMSVYSLRRSEQKSLYYATLDGKLVYSGDSAADLRTKVEHEAASAGASVAYLNASTFDARHAAALRHSLTVSASGGEASPIFVLDRNSTEFADQQVSLADKVLGKNVVDIITTQPVKVDAGFTASATFVHADGTSLNSRVFAKSRDLLKTFLDVLDEFAAKLRVRFASIDPATNAAVRARALDAVNLAYAETANRTGISEREIRSRLYVQFASFQVAMQW